MNSSDKPTRLIKGDVVFVRNGKSVASNLDKNIGIVAEDAGRTVALVLFRGGTGTIGKLYHTVMVEDLDYLGHLANRDFE